VGIPLVLAAAAIFWWLQYEGEERSGHPVLYGNVDIREVRLAFNGSEHVGTILVEEGDRVEAGQLLARLHTDRLQAERRRLAAEVSAAEAEAHADNLSHQRIARLAQQHLASQDDADVSEAKARVAAARVKAAQAALAEVDQRLKDTALYAPQAGVIRERVVEEGDFVTPQSPVLTLALIDPVWVRTYVPETYLGRVTLGGRAQVRTDSYPDKVYEGWIGYISPTAEFTPKTVETPELRTRLVYQMRVYVCNPGNSLLLGMPVTVTLQVDGDLTEKPAAGAPCRDAVGGQTPEPP
jgi:HlyD family secretion protein